jgi:CheY-like chemotaxis protein
MPSGGSLLVSLETASVEAARVATTGPLSVGEYVLLKVADTGSGIAPEILERIFDPFFTTKEVGVGTGLGLSLVHGIVTGLGGVIDVATTVGQGSAFSVFLPHAGELSHPIGPARRTDPETLRGANERILVVDDEESLVSLAAETLTGLGYVVDGFTASGAALAAFVANPGRFDAIVTDESMPGMSGVELIGKMRAIKPTIPILLVSGYVNAALVQRAMRAGVFEVLRKPLSAQQLAAGVDRLLHKAKSRRVENVALAASAKTGTKRRSRASPSPSRAPRR